MRTLFLLCLLAIALPSSAEVSERLVYTDYVAQADPDSSLPGALSAASPHRQNGRIYHAYTTWYVQWRFRWQENVDGSCKITQVTTALSGNINLPRLVGASDVQQEKFKRYLSALHVHELGHYSIGKDAAMAIDSKLQALPDMPSCKTLASTANEIGYRMLDEYKAREVQYDASTSHGRTQGAWLDQ